jgi:hypothetical protein
VRFVSGGAAATAAEDPSLYCRCSALHPGCRLLPFIPEVYEGEVSCEDDYYDIDTQNKLNNTVGTFHPRSAVATRAASCLQRLARAYFGRVQLGKMRAYVLGVRRQACRNYWDREVMGAVWGKLDRTYERYRDSAELDVMRVEEERGRAYNSYYYLQAALKGMNLMNQAVNRLIAGCCLYFPNRSARPPYELDYNHSHLRMADFEESMSWGAGARSRPGSTAASTRKHAKSGGSRFGKKRAGPASSKDTKKPPTGHTNPPTNPPTPALTPPAEQPLALVPVAGPRPTSRDADPPGSPGNNKPISRTSVKTSSIKTASIRTAVRNADGPKSSLALSKAALAKPAPGLAPLFGHELFAPPPISPKMSTKINFAAGTGGLSEAEDPAGLLAGSAALYGHAFSGTGREDAQATRAFCWNSARSLQLRLPYSDMRRMTPAELALASRYFPLYVSPSRERNLLTCDADIGTLAGRFVSDVYSEGRRYAYATAVAREAQRKEIVRLGRRRAKVDQQNRAAQAASNAKLAEAAREERVQQESVKRATLATSSKGPPPVTQKKKPPPRVPVIKPPALPNLVVLRELKVVRRVSIGDPAGMTGRLERAAAKAQDLCSGAYGYSLRRPSLPAQLRKLRPRVPLWAAEAQTEILLSQSLELFALRLSMMVDCLASPLYVFPPEAGAAAAMQRFDPASPQTNARLLMDYCFLNPRLPCELNEMLVTDNKRRHSIAEPERLAKQLKMQYQMRSCVATVRHQAKRGRFGGMEASDVPKLPSMPYRRRSFDMGEQKDLDDGVTSRLGYSYEPPIKHFTIFDLKKQSTQLKKMVTRARWNELGRAVERRGAADARARGRGAGGAGAAGGGFAQAMALVPATPGERPVEVWQQYAGADPSDLPYYHCVESGVTCWDEPYGDHVQILTRHENDKGKFFWFNTVTGESHWDAE